MSEEYEKALEAIQSVNLNELFQKIAARNKRLDEIEKLFAELQLEKARLSRENILDNSIVQAFRSQVPSRADRLLSRGSNDSLKDLTIIEACKRIFTEIREPLHINVIVQLLQQGGVTFRTENPSESVEATLRKESDLFEKIGSRTYRLKNQTK